MSDSQNNTNQDRRTFLKSGGIAIAASGVGLLLNSESVAATPKQENYTKFLNPNPNLGELTESARQMVSRDKLLSSVLEKLPTAERAEQIYNVLAAHILAEEAGDTDATMATMDKNPVFESLPEGKIYQGHQSVADDYARRYYGLTRKLHITNLTVDSKGAFAEMLWEGYQKNTYVGVKPVKNAKRFFIPMVVYYEVTNEGLIKRESVYYDQYLGALSLELIPDILSSKLQLIRLNPGLLFRRG